MNIWVPEAALVANSDPLPVLVYIHGGAFFGGNNAKWDEDGGYIANEQNIIVVKINYRLGVLGFWHLDTKEEGQDFQGNWGILDQRLGLKWIYENIAAFGGDPNLITISGCSAGGQSVWIHLQEEPSWEYFQKAIVFAHPGGRLVYRGNLHIYRFFLGIPYFYKDQAIGFYSGNAKNMNCTTDAGEMDMACLRETSVDDLMAGCWSTNLLLNNGPWAESLKYQMVTQMGEPYAPVIDQEVVTDHSQSLK